MKYLIFFILITFFANLIFNDIDFFNVICFFLGSAIAIVYIKNKPLHGNYAKYIVLLGVYFSVIVLPAYHLIVYKGGPSQIEYNRTASFGTILFFITMVAFLLADNFKVGERKSNKIIIYKPRVIGDSFVKKFFILIYFLTAVAFTLGIGRMGKEDVVLPFKLTGIINLFRFYAVAFIFAAIVENYHLRGVKFPKKYFVTYFVWTIFEVFAWMSKSVLVSYLLPLFLVLYIYYRPPFTKVVKMTWPLVAAFLFLYPIIGILRSIDSGNFIENFKEARSQAYDNDNESSTFLLVPLNRVFMTGSKYITDYDYFNHDDLFSFTNLPLVLAAGGAPGFQTRVIDGFDESVHTSSGTTGIIDPMLHGGYGLCYIILVLIVFVSVFIDNQFWKKQYSIYVILLLMLYNWILFANISMLYDGNGMQTTIMEVGSIFFAYYINFKKKDISYS